MEASSQSRLEQGTRTWAIPSLVVARIVYAINWMNIGAIFYLMRTDLGGGVAGLGSLASSFYLGVGIMQIPGGILAARKGPKKTITLGILISSLAVLGTSVSTLLAEVAVLRFIVGTGMALVFAPLVVLSTRFFGGKSGVGAGVINSAFGIGGLLGLFGWIVVASSTGWRPSLYLSGGLGLVTALLVFVLVPDDREGNDSWLSINKLSQVLKNRSLILLGLACLSSNLGSVLISSFMVFYLNTELGASPVLAGLATASVVALPVLTSLVGGRLYDRQKRPRRLLFVAGLGMVVALVVCSVPSILVASLGAALAGIVVGPSSTISFAAAKDLSGVEREYDSLSIGWVNCISLTGSVWPPLVFSFLAGNFGYPVAWLGGAVMSTVLLAPMIFLVPRKPQGEN